MLIALETLGCRLNEAELESWGQQFNLAGHQVVRQTDQADVIVLNTCAVTRDAVRKSRNLIRRLRKNNPQAKLVVSGCYATLEQSDLAEELGVDLVVSNSDKAELARLLSDRFGLAAEDPSFLTEQPPPGGLFSLGRQRAFIKVQDGCRYHCTFCIVTVARGEEVSRPVEDIVREINHLHQQQGINEAVLTGVHLGGYEGSGNMRLDGLVRTILEQTGIPRLRLGSLEPWDIPENFAALFDNPRLMPHLHLPLQSGSDPVLKRMGRRCSTSRFSELCGSLRDKLPDINITTDVITGFPGETDSDWQDSLAFVEQTGFGHIHVFSYSSREGTAAAGFEEQIPKQVRKQRSQQLHKLAERMKQNTLDRFVGRTLPVLIEGNRQEPSPVLAGYTPNYLRVMLTEKDASLINTIQLVTLTAAKDGHLEGSIAHGA